MINHITYYLPSLEFKRLDLKVKNYSMAPITCIIPVTNIGQSCEDSANNQFTVRHEFLSAN